MSKIVAIGALGGSGTRAVAKIIIEAGIYMGDDLNEENDNLIFTRLFKNPAFHDRSSIESINERLCVFREYMERDHLTLKNATFLINSSISNPVFQQNYKLLAKVLRKVLNRPKNRELWGWKEPNTQIYIEEVSKYFEGLKYIHIVRNGLDMAFSKNKQQLRNWGYKYNIDIHGSENKGEIAYKQLQYWIKSTKDSISKGEKLGNDFMLLNHTAFCKQPKEQVDRIIDFLGLEIGKEKRNELYKIPKIPSSLGRYKKYDLKIFDKEQIDFVKELGFEV